MTHRLTSILIALALVLASAVSAQAQTWPNEPSGSTLLSDHSFTSVAGDGWATNSGALTIVSDGSAPQSPSSVLQMSFPPGLQGGTSPGAVYFPLGTTYREMYMGFWWKASTNWEGGAMGGGQKISFFQPTGSWNLVMLLNPDHTISVYFPNDSQVNNCNLSPSWGDCPGTRQLYGGVWNPQVSFGVWHRIETYVKMSSSTTSQDGIIRWWIDGNLAGNFTTVNFPQYPISQVELDSTWGNVGDVKTTTTQFWFDHVRVTRGGTSSGGGGTSPPPPPPPPPSPPSPPNAPTLLRRLP